MGTTHVELVVLSHGQREVIRLGAEQKEASKVVVGRQIRKLRFRQCPPSIHGPEQELQRQILLDQRVPLTH